MSFNEQIHIFEGFPMVAFFYVSLGKCEGHQLPHKARSGSKSSSPSSSLNRLETIKALKHFQFWF